MSLTIPQRTALLAALVLVTVAVALPALGCPVCYGEAEGEIITGTKWSVAFLGCRPIAAVVDGAIADLTDVRGAIAVSAAVALTGAVFGLTRTLATKAD